MSEMEEKLGNILSNPALMQQIMTMAQSLNAPPPTANPPPQAEANLPEIDAATLQKFIRLAQHSGIDPDQRALLSALTPYLSRGRIGKLEKAMRAVKLANIASSALGSGLFSFLSGR